MTTINDIDFTQDYRNCSNIDIYSYIRWIELYNKYKDDQNIARELSQDSLNMIIIIETLENLGYPLNNIGTFYYARLIQNAISKIYTNKELLEKIYSLDEESYISINDTYNELSSDIDIEKDFIKKSKRQIEYKNKNENLYKAIFGEADNINIEELIKIENLTNHKLVNLIELWYNESNSLRSIDVPLKRDIEKEELIKKITKLKVAKTKNNLKFLLFVKHISNRILTKEEQTDRFARVKKEEN